MQLQHAHEMKRLKKKVTRKIGKLLPTHAYHCLSLVLFTNATKLSHSLTLQELVQLHKITGDYIGRVRKKDQLLWVTEIFYEC